MDSENRDLEVILPAHRIPEGSVVYKVSGEKPYVLKSEIKFYDQEKYPNAARYDNIVADKNIMFLVSGSGIDIISSDKKLKWKTYREELNWMFESEDDR